MSLAELVGIIHCFLERKLKLHIFSIHFSIPFWRRRFEFSSFEDAENTISRFTAFYNNERLHSAIDYRTPRKVYEKWKENIIEGSA